MTDDTASDTPRPRPRPRPLGRVVLARIDRLARAGGRGLGRDVAERHDGQRLATPPRLAPTAHAALARSPAPSDPAPADDPTVQDEAERLSSLSGFSPSAMEYLVRNAPPAGSIQPSLGDSLGELQRVAGERASARSRPARRAAIEEGAPQMRLSRTPAPRPGAGASPAASPMPDIAPEPAVPDPAATHAVPEPSAQADAAPGPPDAGAPPPSGQAQPRPAASLQSRAAGAPSPPARMTVARRPAPGAPSAARGAAPVRLARRPRSEPAARPVIEDVGAHPEDSPESAVAAFEDAPAATAVGGPVRRLWRRAADRVRGAPPGEARDAASPDRAAPPDAAGPQVEDLAPPAPASAVTVAPTAVAGPSPRRLWHRRRADVALASAAPSPGPGAAPAYTPSPESEPERAGGAAALPRPASAPAWSAARPGSRPAARLARSPLGTASATADSAPAFAPGGARQPLRVLRSPRRAADRTPPVPATATAAVLATATAGAIAYEDDGRVSVLFPPPGSLSAAPGGTVARDEAAAPAPHAEAAAVPVSTTAEASVPAAAPHAPPTAAAPLDREELYADFMRRLRRDVLDQREQLGEL